MQKCIKQWPTRSVLAGTLILSALPLPIMELFPGQLKFVMSAASYSLFHNLAEIFSIMVSLSMFGAGWYTYDQSKDRHALFLSAAFLTIGLMDFMHTLSMAAMPDFITPNVSNKSIQFWIAVRLFQAAAFLASAYVYADTANRWLTKKVMIISALLLPFLAFSAIIFFPAHLPTTFVPGVGLTPFKKFSEYLIILVLCVAVAAYWRRMNRTRDRLLIYYPAAFIICIFSEIPFALYTRIFDAYNMLGHIYKVAAFSLIYYGIYKASVRAPYLRLTEVGEQLRKDIVERKRAEEALKELNEKLENRVVERTATLQHLTETLEQRVQERTAELADLSTQLVTAQENERKRVSYDLHDKAWQMLVAIRFEIERLFSGEEGKNFAVLQAKSKKVVAAMLDTVAKVRSMQGDLWPYVLDDIGILATVDWYCREFEKSHSGITIKHHTNLGEHEIPSSAKIVVYRILQETLSNVAKHSHASRVTLGLLKKDHGFEFSVKDNGVGFDPEETMVKKAPWGGLGLLTIKARTELSGGQLRIETAIGEGTTVRAFWSIQKRIEFPMAKENRSW